jgi:hypothetical protein
MHDQGGSQEFSRQTGNPAAARLFVGAVRLAHGLAGGKDRKKFHSQCKAGKS